MSSRSAPEHSSIFVVYDTFIAEEPLMIFCSHSKEKAEQFLYKKRAEYQDAINKKEGLFKDGHFTYRPTCVRVTEVKLDEEVCGLE